MRPWQDPVFDSAVVGWAPFPRVVAGLGFVLALSLSVVFGHERGWIRILAVLLAWNEYRCAFLPLSGGREIMPAVAFGLLPSADDRSRALPMATGVLHAPPQAVVYHVCNCYRVSG